MHQGCCMLAFATVALRHFMTFLTVLEQEKHDGSCLSAGRPGSRLLAEKIAEAGWRRGHASPQATVSEPPAAGAPPEQSPLPLRRLRSQQKAAATTPAEASVQTADPPAMDNSAQPPSPPWQKDAVAAAAAAAAAAAETAAQIASAAPAGGARQGGRRTRAAAASAQVLQPGRLQMTGGAAAAEPAAQTAGDVPAAGNSTRPGTTRRGSIAAAFSKQQHRGKRRRASTSGQVRWQAWSCRKPTRGAALPFLARQGPCVGCSTSCCTRTNAYPINETMYPTDETAYPVDGPVWMQTDACAG